jgi:hypothetical protein
MAAEGKLQFGHIQKARQRSGCDLGVYAAKS